VLFLLKISMKKEYRLLGMIFLEVALVLLAHWGLLQWLAEKQVVASLLSAGGHLPRLTVVLAVNFVLIRFLALFILPGLVGVRLAQVVFYLWVEKSREPADPTKHLSPEPSPTKS
jgi:hypothetical protein